jgi:hypothetical protein
MQSAANQLPTAEEPSDSANDRISAAEAAEILGLDRGAVYRLMAKGRLPTHGGPHSYNQLRRGDVVEYRDRGERIALAEAARILRRSIDGVRELVRQGELVSIANSRRPVFRNDVEQYAAANPPPARTPPAGRDGQVGTPQAARILGISPSNTRRLAAEGKIPPARTTPAATGIAPTSSHCFSGLGPRPRPPSCRRRNSPGLRPWSPHERRTSRARSPCGRALP